MSISLIIPCYNYEKLLIKNYHKLQKKIKNINEDFEIIYIDDGSTDKTYKKLNFLKKKNKKIKIIKNRFNFGKSYSLIRGIKHSKYNKIVIYDCDLPYFIYFNRVINLLKKYSFVYINRRSNESSLEIKNLSFYQLTRFTIGRFICSVINLFCLNKEIGDTQAGLKAFIKPKKFNKIKFISKKFFFDAEIIILFSFFKKSMKYIPIKYQVPKDSTIKIFEFKNFIYVYELLKVIIYYNLTNIKRYKKNLE